MRAMWKQSSTQTDTPEAAAATQRSINHSLMSAADVLAESPPLKIAKRSAWNERGESAFRKLDTDGQSVAQLRAQYNRYLVSEVKDPTARAAKLARFTQRLLQLKRGS